MLAGLCGCLDAPALGLVRRHSPGKRGVLLRKGEELREESQAPPSGSAARQEDQLLLLESRTAAYRSSTPISSHEGH